MITLNKDLKLDAVTDYNETEQAEMTNRLLPDHMSGLVEWYGYGTIAGLRARAVYYTTRRDQTAVEANGGDWGGIDWERRMDRVDILTEDNVVVASISNEGHDTEDEKAE